MTDINTSSERAKFEAWFCEDGNYEPEWLDGRAFDGGFSYSNADTENMWQAWQARAALDTQPAAPADVVAPEQFAELLSQFECAAVRCAKLHREYMGKAMSDQTYDTFATLRDDTIPALRKRLLAALASPAQAPAAPSVGEPVAQLDYKAMYEELFASASGHLDKYCAACRKTKAVDPAQAAEPVASTWVPSRRDMGVQRPDNLNHGEWYQHGYTNGWNACLERIAEERPRIATPPTAPAATEAPSPLSVACPHCWQKAGEPCIWPETRKHNRDAPHDARKLAALATPVQPVPEGLSDEQIVILRRTTMKEPHQQRASDIAFARAIEKTLAAVGAKGGEAS